ncbi:MAG: hypothetical protein JSR82_09290 [Verrucomicrobia bacterium]|nr:hypothetical protein [Verrucomicrobiota bacterium]
MQLAEFIAQLRASGVALLSGERWLQAGPLASELQKLDAAERAEFPGEAPALALPAAAWAAEWLHQACLAVVDREIEADEARRWLTKPCPLPGSAEVIYSADLLLRHLPELLQLARRLSARDPVTADVETLCRQWPYSAVGAAAAPETGQAQLELIAAHRGLRRAFADRVLARRDATRLGLHPLLDDAVRAALGAHPELAPELAARLDAAGGAVQVAS